MATIQTMAQLLNPKTAIRNLVGNIGLSTAENAADFIGTGIDKLISLKTKKRTMSLPSLGTQIKGGATGAKDQARDIKEGINTFTQGTKHDLPRMKTFRSGPLSKLEDAMNYELRVPDRAFYEGARQDSLRQQMKLAKVSKPTPEMEAIAEQDALYSNPAKYERNRRFGHLVYVLGRTADGAKLPSEGLRLNASISESHLNLQRYSRHSHVFRYR